MLIVETAKNKSIDFKLPKEFDDAQVFDDPKGISIGSRDFDNPKVYSAHPSWMVL